ncbi:ribbon-helix-helix domain-containing protein [Marinobacter salexigens]|uniref:Ribbon-helix-helix domain-containing protein n=1 Tax=Marinobacter salexigens TaxID=1925763 RepID=A0ABS6A8G0_9GAMM|nr:ribbon-helix-helix domain-containing protein [Marinobacter salexigens]MBU2873548.1 ribbon-helix-helix domain-containing protein [Marinobacter salexigens]
MCKLFINADPELWVSRTHSLRIDGMVTSVRMENAFWHVLAELAERDGMNLPQMITRLYHESIDAGHDLGNFTSFLRVCALRYLELQLDGDVPRDTRVPIASLNADRILASKPCEAVMPKVITKARH